MANSKAYLSFVLHFAFLISSHVLTHELPEGHKHSYNDEGNKFKYPTWSQDLEKDWKRGSTDVEERIPAHNTEGHELEGSTSGSVDQVWDPSPPPPPLIDPLLPRAENDHSVGSTSGSVDQIWHPPPPRIDSLSPRAEKDHYTHSIGYQFSGLKDIDAENYADGSVMQHRKMMRPSEIDWRSFHAFPTKTSGMTHGGKTGYNGVPKMEEVGEETKN